MPKRPGILKRWNRWYYRIYHAGAQREYGAFASQEDAYHARQQHLRELQKNQKPTADILLKDFVVLYLENHEKVHNRESTVIKAEGICRLHIVPALGRHKLRNITTSMLVEFQKDLVQHKTPSVSHNTMRILRRVLNTAVQWGFLPFSPLRASLPPAPKKEHPTLPVERIHGMINELDGRDKYVIALLALTGARRSEVFGLKWADFDWSRNTVGFIRQHTQGRVVELKTDRSRAVVPMGHDLSTLMREWKLQCGSFEWVFQGRGKKPLSGEWWASQVWPGIRDRFELPEGFRIHDFRHSYATNLLLAGVPLERVSRLLRHKSIKTTFDLYGHMVPAHFSEDVKVLDSGYREGYREGQELTH